MMAQLGKRSAGITAMFLTDTELLTAKDYYHSLSLLTCLDHWLQGLLVYTLPHVLTAYHPHYDFYQLSIWLYGTWITTYASKPLGIAYFHHYLKYHDVRKTLIYTNLLWLFSGFCIMLTPLLDVSLLSLGCIFFLSRCIGQICIAGENTLARTLLINIDRGFTRIQKNRYYERAVITGYFLSCLSGYFLSWIQALSIILLLGSVCFILRIHNAQLTYLPHRHETTIPYNLYLLLTSGMCFSYLAYSIGITYIYPFNPQPLTMAGIFLWNMLLLTVCPQNLASPYQRGIILISSISILLGIYGLIFYPLDGYALVCIQLWTISHGVLFDVYFFSYIKHLFATPIPYLSLGFLGWAASLIYGKYLPWLLLLSTQQQATPVLALITTLIALPSMGLLLIVAHKQSK